METPPTPMSSPAPVTPGTLPPKKGLGTAAKVGIGCGAIILLAIIGVIVVSVMFGGKIMDFAEEAQKNPARATATMMVKASGGKLEMVAEDDENLRYTVKDTTNGSLTTIYWSETKGAPEVIQGDFAAIPTEPVDDEPESYVDPVPESEN